MLKARAEMDDEEHKRLSVMITQRLLALDCVKNAACVMAYITYRNEPDLSAFMRRCLEAGKRVALPCIAGKGEMTAAGFRFDCVMKSNAYGIPEPVLTGGSDLEEPDVIIVPGVAFDERLNRVGFGAGYYDRFLKSTEAEKIGVCFDYQVVKSIGAAADHDVCMDMIITEKRILGDSGCG